LIDIIARLDSIQNELLEFRPDVDPARPGARAAQPSVSDGVRLARTVLWIETLMQDLRAEMAEIERMRLQAQAQALPPKTD